MFATEDLQHTNKKKKPQHNLLNPTSDQHLISPYSNAAESVIKITRIKKMITNLGRFDC